MDAINWLIAIGFGVASGLGQWLIWRWLARRI